MPADRRRRPARPIALFGEAVLDVARSGTTLGGAPFNVACHLGRLGCRVLLVTRVGSDAGGREILRAIRACGLGRAGVQVDPCLPTGRVRVRHGARGPSFAIPVRQAFDAIDVRAARAAFSGARPGLLYFGTLAQRGEPSRSTLAALLRLKLARTFLDVNLRAPWWDEVTLARSLEAAT
ncbi:MAG TPA: PfkB family carbohydrate kinase, partial [Thermoanaerobaculia bacterium]|nr:PfkB family carbohydrate kinase [Thermoanaerobaculia bacterium]